MTKIDFYILQATDRQAQYHFACRLAEKAITQGNTVMINAGTPDTSQTLDALLWSFKPESFLPHTIIEDDITVNTEHASAEHQPIAITHGKDDARHHDVLINIHSDRPSHFSRFSRLAEIVVQDEEVLQSTRHNYAFYKSRGYQISTHKIP